MVSKRFPQLDRRLVRRLLRTGARVPSGQAELRQVVTILKELGLITTTHRRYMKCANPNDEDYWDVPDRNCPSEIELEDEGPYECPICGRIVEYPAIHKEVFEDLHITVQQQGVANYLFTALKEVDIVAAIKPVGNCSA